MQDQEKTLTILFLNSFSSTTKGMECCVGNLSQWNLVNSANTGYDY